MFTTRPTTRSSRWSAWTNPTSSWWAKFTPPSPPAPGRGQINDHEYVRNGVAEIFLEVEPLGGRRHVAITEHRTAQGLGLLHQRHAR